MSLRDTMLISARDFYKRFGYTPRMLSGPYPFSLHAYPLVGARLPDGGGPSLFAKLFGVAEQASLDTRALAGRAV
ncbi:hypothetical protein [Microvirga sp. M2]|uniref:hypothetical protein n=1 Tax=Microvirga sp. M2 TaxID=3073270 RepID=UPI0039C452B3